MHRANVRPISESSEIDCPDAGRVGFPRLGPCSLLHRMHGGDENGALGAAWAPPCACAPQEYYFAARVRAEALSFLKAVGQVVRCIIENADTSDLCFHPAVR